MPKRRRSFVATLLLLVLLAAALWTAWVYTQIHYYATHDEAAPADAIAVFGAAEYDGRPSPVLRARLDHALELYGEKLAPLVIPLGGGDPTERTSEGGVGKAYLLAHGVPEAAIIAETKSRDTRESAGRLARIAQANHLARILVVSDGTHLFRIHALCQAEGLDVITSPRPELHPLAPLQAAERLAHEVLSYSGWRLHIH
jgi:uncharacterized SAM-binding protein YcdF (DUF218 family)